MALYKDDSLMLHNDLYQINMAETYWNDGIHERKAIFDLYFRKMPFDSGYAVFNGLKRVIEFIQDFHFSESDIDYLKSLGYQDDFLSYLEDLTFTGNIRSMQEGELCFSNEPLLRVEAPLIQAQLIETALLNIINFQTLIATKASRIKQIAPDDTLMEFGTRRAHELDAAIWGARAAFIGGFDSTSNVRAGKMFDIPVSGTHAHAMVQTYGDEYVAFKKYAERHKDCVFLVDTFHTLKSGMPNAIKVAKELGDSINFIGVRLDSGDIAYLSKEARRMLDEAGFTDAKVIASNDLDEQTITSLKAQGAKVDSWGVGTKLITAFQQPALGAVYKLAAIEDENGEYIDRIKLSNNAEKVTTPGKKNVYRIINRKSNKSEGDYITLDHENPNEIAPLKMFHPVHTYKMKFIKKFDAIDLHHDIFLDGKLIYDMPTERESQMYLKDNLNYLWDENKRYLNPEDYPVDLSTACWENKHKRIFEVAEQVKEMEEEHE
ncbi:nicotinate phosphoribosyltransferase [Staphylococcus massiliensis]|uniref:Nicotinate phosphoribosyltransferase n=1 Tax=Staphylococcus massiliensis S46 TaxID=1229783 RepID=K9ALH8_9STAP|nr:nicotinate phosphoribosyltransferase [Staphylococcus massiliensis]EKU46861.1 nicotinate phosphoribosyltransferase [Staphylococcus massiliensis S46]MCG3399924.1 nicotinate phosphoribosyltransferase [Staphylococcus massiliensis]MCG3402643.1 nicotinate phosphoribosyltransferase [Staphylococcus massiliensis]MCG3412890.1 nicotinate phosphoribosyltransferase [Staphylococcus massiliensis]PNZ98097.1 nicotinate phosphoribosyltransferase [Staphylococcus massiliensis CCUG 55927]